jgi:hypothetical protein
MQWIASTALTVASLIVAVVALRFSYRSNHGWAPIIYIIRQGLSHMGNGEEKLTIQFEVWNRRKYPIVINACGVSFANTKVEAICFSKKRRFAARYGGRSGVEMLA